MKIIKLSILSLFCLTNIICYKSVAQAPANLWAKQFSSTGLVSNNNIAIDQNRNVYNLGVYNNNLDLDPGPNQFLAPLDTNAAIFIQKLDSNGNFVFGKTIHTSGNISTRGLVIDKHQKIYICGSFEDTVDFDPGPGVQKLVSKFHNRIFLLKLDQNGEFIWVKEFNPSNQVKVFSLLIDDLNNLILSGSVYGTVDCDPSPNSFILNTSYENPLVMQLDSNGNFNWAKYFQGTNIAVSQGAAVDLSGNIFLTGFFKGTINFEPSTSQYISTSNGKYDTFFAKLSQQGTLLWNKTFGSSTDDSGFSCSVDKDGSSYVVGMHSGTTDFDPGSSSNTINVTGNHGGYISKYDSIGNYLWTKTINSQTTARVKKSLVDQNGNLFFTGDFGSSTDFDPGSGTQILSRNGNSDEFILSLDINGNFNWVKPIALSASGSLDVLDFKIDMMGNLYTCGYFGYTANFGTNSNPNIFNSNQNSLDGFVLKTKKSSIINSLSINQTNLKLNFFPNPSKGLVNFRFEKAFSGNYKLINSEGLTIRTGKIFQRKDFQLFLPDKNGLYILTLQSKFQKQSFRLIKK